MTKKVVEASKYKGLSYFHKKGGLEPKGDQLNGIPVHEETYNYDKRGNLTHIYKDGQLVNQYYFGALNRLESAVNNESGLGATYKYNGLGNRVGKVEGTPIEPVLPLNKLRDMSLNPTKQIDDVIDLTKQYHNLLQRNEDDKDTAFTWDNNVLAATGTEGVNNYFQDDLGSPVRMMDRLGREQNAYGYDEFGREIYKSQKEIQTFGYTGYQRDSITNTYFAQAREYRPEIGRFTARDVKKGNGVYPYTLNTYGYCWNRPVDLVDLNGKTSISALDELLWSNPDLDRDAVNQLEKELNKAIDDYQNIGQILLTTNNTDQSLSIVFENDKYITEASKKYGVDKAMIQSIVFQELRFYNVLDIPADISVYLGVRSDSSTGLGQIFASTAIDAYNLHYGTSYDRTNSGDLKYFWKKLQDDSYNIDMVGMVLSYKAKMLAKELGREPTIQEIMMAYNGSGDLAEKYMMVTSEYYKAFQNYETCD